jgi:hypothetical protein
MAMDDSDKAKMHRLRAVLCDQRASKATDPQLKRDWAELAIEWHLLAREASGAEGDDGQIESA